MAFAVLFNNISKLSGKSIESSEFYKSIANTLSIISGGFGFLSLLLIVAIILIDEDSANLFYNILLLVIYAFLVFKAQLYTISIVRGNKKTPPK